MLLWIHICCPLTNDQTCWWNAEQNLCFQQLRNISSILIPHPSPQMYNWSVLILCHTKHSINLIKDDQYRWLLVHTAVVSKDLVGIPKVTKGPSINVNIFTSVQTMHLHKIGPGFCVICILYVLYDKHPFQYKWD